MSRVALTMLHLAALPVDGHEAPGVPLTLACEGLATNPVGDPTRGHASRMVTGRKAVKPADDDGDTAAPSATPARSGRGTPVEFRFEFADDHGRVQYPAAIVPVVHSGGDRDGWWPVRDLAVTDAAYSGRVLLNFVNHARFTIDRQTGAFTLVGLQANVTGHCARAEHRPQLF